MPPDFNEMQQKSRHILVVSRAVRDLTEADEDEIMAIDNYDWDSEDWVHLCLGPERCLAKCGGNPETARTKMKESALLAVGSAPPTPLLYRWRGFEAFSSALYRGRRCHDAWLASHAAM